MAANGALRFTAPVPRLVHPFGPVARANARVLLLGSMPGVASLAAGQYYAHPRNQFWPLMGRLFDAGPERPYAERLIRLQAAGLALWDVVGSCERPGSLDADIRDAVPNDLAGLLQRCPLIHTLACNGQAAASLLRPLWPTLEAAAGGPLRLLALPSTSPAHAARSFAQKLRAWRRLAAITAPQPP